MDKKEYNINCSSQLGDGSMPIVDPYHRMVLEAAVPSFWPNVFDEDDIFVGYEMFGDDGELPNCKAKKFYEMLKVAEESTFHGCKTHSTLFVVTILLNIKSKFNLSESCFNCILQLIKELLPKDAKLPNDLYKTK